MHTKEKRSFYYLSNDKVFKYIFGTYENLKYTKDLLECFFHNKEEGYFDNLENFNSHKLDIKTILEKGYEVDVLVKLKNGNFINMEVYNKYGENEERKSSQYLCKIYGNKSLKQRETYDKSRSVIQINFIRNSRIFKNRDKSNNIKDYYITNSKNLNDKVVPDLLKMYIVNLDDIKKVGYTNINKRLKLWLKLLNASTKEELEELANKDKMIGEVIKKMKEFSEDEWVNDFFANDRYLISQGKDEGITIGVAQGKEAEKIKIAKSMLEETIEIPVIHRVTGLPIKEIKKLASELN
ncbi:MAG: Rpn family recombination-promoting nuclease/putative transposase [Ruminococcus sp.]|nr:Rpn family recombination-promoting nuclease/putative transposase [Ruminococcus sp.]